LKRQINAVVTVVRVDFRGCANRKSELLTDPREIPQRERS
jgi:hypothetical protein